MVPFGGVWALLILQEDSLTKGQGAGVGIQRLSCAGDACAKSFLLSCPCLTPKGSDVWVRELLKVVDERERVPKGVAKYDLRG